MFEIGSAIARIKADTSDFQSGIAKVTGGMGGIGDIAVKIGELLAAAFTVTKLIDFGKAVVDAAANAQVQMEKFNTTIANSKPITQAHKQQLLDAADAAVKLGFEEDDVALSLARFYQRTGDVTESLRENQIAMDLSRDKNMDLVTAQKMIGLVLSGNGRALKQYGIDLKASGSPEEALIELQDKLKGSAENYTKTYAGQILVMTAEWTRFKEILGSYVLPILTQLMSKISDLVQFLQGAITQGGLLSQKWKELGDTWSQVLLFLQPLIDWFVANVIPQLKLIWDQLDYFVQQVIPPVVAIITFLIYKIIIPYVTELVAYWKAHWDEISKILKGAWEIISGLVQVAVAVISGIIIVFLDLITGNWKGAADAWTKTNNDAFNGIKNILNGIVSFLQGWGSWLFDSLTQPFRNAWNTISDLVNKIKSALDFTQRHSPSVVDIVENGVNLVNKALANLNVDISPVDTKSMSFGVSGTPAYAINISLDGAIISDEASARGMAERIGDLITQQLQRNVRF